MGSRRHLVWDWNGTLLDDLSLVVDATNAAFARIDGPVVTADQHRRDFRRPIVDYYAHVLGRPVTHAEFLMLDGLFHDAYRSGVAACQLAADAINAVRAWSQSQSLLSMWFHDELVPAVTGYGLVDVFVRVDGLRDAVGGGPKGPHLKAHLAALDIDGAATVLIGDSVDDATAAASVGASCVLYAGGFTDPALLYATGLPVATTLRDAVALAQQV